MKLTKQQAETLLLLAYQDVEFGKSYSYRLGQAIYHHLPPELAQEINGTEQDFFYWKDNDRALETFYKYCVEPL